MLPMNIVLTGVDAEVNENALLSCTAHILDINNDFSFDIEDLRLGHLGDINSLYNADYTEMLAALYPEQNAEELNRRLITFLKENDDLKEQIKLAYMKETMTFGEIEKYERHGDRCYADVTMQYFMTDDGKEGYVPISIEYPFMESDYVTYPYEVKVLDYKYASDAEKDVIREALDREIDKGLPQLYIEKQYKYLGIDSTQFYSNRVEAKVAMEVCSFDNNSYIRTYIINADVNGYNGFDGKETIEAENYDIYDEIASEKLKAMMDDNLSELNEDILKEYQKDLKRNNSREIGLWL